MRNTNNKSILDLNLSDNVILQNSSLKNIKGGAQSAEQAAYVDDIKCENALRKAERINGDGLW